MRIVGGISVFEGRVELCINEIWNTICADGAWTNNDANVACREAGYSATGMYNYVYTAPLYNYIYICICS